MQVLSDASDLLRIRAFWKLTISPNRGVFGTKNLSYPYTRNRNTHIGVTFDEFRFFFLNMMILEVWSYWKCFDGKDLRNIVVMENMSEFPRSKWILQQDFWQNCNNFDSNVVPCRTTKVFILISTDSNV